MDDKAKKILVSAFWGSKGWKSGVVSPDDFTYAKSRGVMFDPIRLSHDQLVRRTIAARDRVTMKMLAKAFLASLSRCELFRISAVESYANCLGLKAHRFKPHEFSDISHLCNVCELRKEPREIDWNVLNFERIKWGGVRQSIPYSMFDLEQFLLEKLPEPTAGDIQLMKAILDVIAASDSADTPAVLVKRLNVAIPWNKDGCRKIVESLACLEILKPTRDGRPSKRDDLWEHAGKWRGEDGYDAPTVRTLLGKFL